MNVSLYIVIIVLLTAAAYFFYKDRLRLISAGLILVFLGLYWLHLKMIPGRLTPDITGYQATLAAWITVICGIVLIIINPRKN